MKKFLSLLILLGIATIITLSGCTKQFRKIDNSRFCVISDLDNPSNCREGQIVAFLPPSWGNDQYPLIFVALYCDFNHQIIYNNGGVVCVFVNKRQVIK
jgi:hypothetical protein